MTSVQTIQPAPVPSPHNDSNTPTTPRVRPLNPPPNPTHQNEDDMATTPTSLSFAEANGKRALPKSPPPPAHAALPARTVAMEESKRPVSQRSNNSGGSGDVDMKDDDEEEESDGEMEDSVDGETGRPTKKKKSQRFFCTDYPPCNLSFTRSEHLARHIRKHTGERPFQCHCSRRFSRLDNLRQHAQTVHVNEDIPGDSLAATGTRFQRQIRTDRVRPAGARSRASTTSSQTSHGRGHARNLSTSSIASTSSNVSTLSSMSQDLRHHPQPMMIAPEQRHSGGLTIDTVRASPNFAYAQSSGGPSTPTSTNYSTGPASPFGSTMGSPIGSSRFPSSQFEPRVVRRLSVPNGVSPFQAGPGPQFAGPMSPGSGYSSLSGSTLASPTSSVFSNRMEPLPSEGERKRRTWHPTTFTGGYYQRPATSGLSYSQTPDAPRPAFATQPQAAATQPVRLPGFGDLMQTIKRPGTPPAQVQPPVAESPQRPQLISSNSSDRGSGFVERPAHRSLDMSFYQNLNRLEIASGTPPRESAGWGQQVLSDMDSAASNVHTSPAQQPQSHFQAQSVPSSQQPLAPARPAQSPADAIMPAAASNQPHDTDGYHHPNAVPRDRRQGWYAGPIAPAPQVVHYRVSPASSSSEGVPTPSNPTFEHHPAIVQPTHPPVAPRPDMLSDQKPMSGLDALVAVATSESNSREGGHR